jgi:hypothetical protein
MTYFNNTVPEVPNINSDIPIIIQLLGYRERDKLIVFGVCFWKKTMTKNNSSKSRFTTNFIISTQVDQSYFPSRFLSFHSPKSQIPVFRPSG